MPRLAAVLILAGVALAALRRRPLVGHWSDCGGCPLSRTVH